MTTKNEDGKLSRLLSQKLNRMDDVVSVVNKIVIEVDHLIIRTQFATMPKDRNRRKLEPTFLMAKIAC
jgi:hypothetical protein